MEFNERAFSQVVHNGLPLWDRCVTSPAVNPTLEDVLKIQEFLHIEAGLLAAYGPDYPLVEPRELIPAFDTALIEYKNLPAFSMVVLDRPLSYQDECFQFDLLLPEGTPSDPGRMAHNRQVMRERLPRNLIADFEQFMGRRAMTNFSRYTQLLPFLFMMDRGYVIAHDQTGRFHLAGVFASFPSDLDGEIKRFGRHIGKFIPGDNESYAANRRWVYRFLMEQLGFPICGERHTSAAIFSRRLLRRGERFLIKVLGNSDRTITTLTSLGARRGLPRVTKAALVAAQGLRKETETRLADEGYILDPKRKTVILRVHYAQHHYHPDNVLEDRALSVLKQEVIHPKTGQTLELDILGLSHDRLLALQDIVRGEFLGSIVYRGRERVEGTSDVKSRLKFLSAWLQKHRLILADYSPDHFERLLRLMSSFLDDPAVDEELARQPELRQEVVKMVAALRLNHRLRLLEKLVANRADASGRKLHLAHVLIILVHVLTQEGEEMVDEHPRSLRKLLRICRRQLEDRSLRRMLAAKTTRTSYEREVVGEAKVLSGLVDELESRLGERKGEKAASPAPAAEARAQEAKGRDQQQAI
jgi:hypothetical protein